MFDDAPPWMECYVLLRDRSVARVTAFLDRFLPARREGLSELSAGGRTFASLDALLAHLADTPTASHVVYWYATDRGPIRAAAVVHTADGALILGLSYPRSYTEFAPTRADLLAFAGVTDHVEGEELSPPGSAAVFEQWLAESRPVPTWRFGG